MPRRILGLVLVVFLAVFLAACSQDTSTSDGPTGPSSPTVTSVTLAGSLSMNIIGQTSQVTATAHFAKGTTQNVTAQATWTSSDATVVTVTGGLVTAVGEGTATIAATYQNVSGLTRVTVTKPPNYMLSGKVTESAPTTSTVLSGARIDFTDAANQGRFATTDGTGQYQLLQVPAGTYTVRATLAGYVDATKQVTVSANTTLDFALVPTPNTIWFTRTGSISASSAGCPGETHPCQAFALPPVHNAGPLQSTLLWDDSNALLALQLVNVDTGQVLASASVPGQTNQYLDSRIQTPGNYQLRVIGVTVSGSVSITLHVTACPN